MGKGNKLCDVILSEDFIIYLKCYRFYCGLFVLFWVDELELLVYKICGKGGMIVR